MGTQAEVNQNADSLFMNKRMLEMRSDTWDEREIVSRGKWMAGMACGIWPGPETRPAT